MTGFGKATAELPDKKITVEIKSLNSKQFDMNVRMPSCYRSVELELRGLVASRLERGKVDMCVAIERTGSSAAVSFDTDAMTRIKNAVTEASRTVGIPEPADWWSLMTRFTETMAADNDKVADDDETSALTKAVAEATEALMSYRRAEGIRLEEFFAERIRIIGELLSEVPRYETERIDRIKARLADGLTKIPAVEYDKGRLEQEMIFYIEKLDVTEEKQRLGQHLSYFMETMRQPAPGQGKKLGFIAQEMGREINTLGSKSNQAEMQNLVVRMKDQLEQIKEQVLNVM